MILTTLTLLILLCFARRESRGARAEPSLMNPLLLDVFC